MRRTKEDRRIGSDLEEIDLDVPPAKSAVLRQSRAGASHYRDKLHGGKKTAATAEGQHTRVKSDYVSLWQRFFKDLKEGFMTPP